MWVYRHPINNLVLFDYRKGRGKSGHKEQLSSFKGTIQCDGVAEYAFGVIANWYAHEGKYRETGLSPQEKLLRRQVDIKPGFDAFTRSGQLTLIEPFFEDGRIHLDNNAIENKIRPLALGRKNFLFAGSHEGAKRIAMMYSFFASCKEADVNPYTWMTDTLNRIGNHPINKISELLPSNFQKL